MKELKKFFFCLPAALVSVSAQATNPPHLLSIAESSYYKRGRGDKVTRFYLLAALIS
jgi:hypothetical protein